MSTPITLDEVRSALERAALDPRRTNASAVRALVGNRGSLKTLQRHLDALRDERAQAEVLPAEPVPIPSVPTGFADTVWRAAWDAAQATAGHHTARLMERIAALEVEVSTAAADRASALERADELAQALAEAQVATEAVEQERARLAAALSEMQVRLAQTEALNVRAATMHAEQVEELRRQLAAR